MLKLTLTSHVNEIFSNDSVFLKNWLTEWIHANIQNSSFGMPDDVKAALGEKFASSLENTEFPELFLSVVRILAREKAGIESLLNNDLCEKILNFAGLPPKNGVVNDETRNYDNRNDKF
uniref:Uncharacterized protein n=1 Tax=Caenorhabditis japonica TaxID=281687 RepID=A0A8R1ETJ5_CAEJA